MYIILQVFENKVLRNIFGPKRDDQTGEWRRLHNAELHDLYVNLDITRIVKSRRLRWAGHVTRMGNERGAWKLLVGKQTRMAQLEGQVGGGRIILTMI